MIGSNHLRIRRIRRSFLLLSLLLGACGGDSAGGVEEIEPPSLDTVEEAAEIEAGEPEFEGETFEEAELPEDFPSSFPIPDDARIGSNVEMGGDDEFRVFLSLTITLNDALAYYRSELPARNWTIVTDEVTNRGTEMAITNDEYEGELLFVDAEMGVVVDVYLYLPGTVEAIPDLPTEFGDSGTLGEGASSFPPDFPIPSSYSPLELSDSLRAEGYELAFTYVGIAEMGMIDFNIALMSTGWEIGDMALEGMSGVYVLPFSSPNGDFEGYAYITNNPAQFNLDTGGAVLIGLAPGTP